MALSFLAEEPLPAQLRHRYGQRRLARPDDQRGLPLLIASYRRQPFVAGLRRPVATIINDRSKNP
jgi:hypothetical protein